MMELFMPKLGPSIEEATVVRWHKSQGQALRQGEPLVDIETDKTVQELVAETDGVLHKILISEGELCAVGTVLALVGAAGESVAGTPETALAGASGGGTSTSMAPAPAVSAATQTSIGDSDPVHRLLIRSSPAARRVARERGVDLSAVVGTGPRGRVVVEDVERAASVVVSIGHAAGTAPPPSAVVRESPGETPIVGCAATERRPLTSMRRAIAERMVRSKRDTPHFYISMEVDMTGVKAARDRWKGAGETTVPSYNDFVLWAAARTLRDFPELNASFAGDDLIFYADINIGMATSVPDGLIVPVIKLADRMSVRGVACHSRELAAKARDRKLAPADCEGGTFTVSNLGMLGVDTFVAIINPPQCAILAVGQVTPRVVTDGQAIAIRTQMTATLSVDHRVTDGVMASRFLAKFKEMLETFQDVGAS